MPMTAQLIKFAAPPLGESVSMLTVGLGHRPSSEIVRSRIHTPLPILPFRVPSLIRPPQNFRPGAYLPGFRPSSRLHRQRLLTAASTQLLLSSVLRFSQPLDGLLRYQLSGLVSSRCHVQGFASRSRRSLFTRRPSLVRKTDLHAGSSTFAHRFAPAATSALASFEASFRVKQRSRRCAV